MTSGRKGTPSNYIDGRWQPTRRSREVVSPLSGKPYATVPIADAEDLVLAVDAAARAFSEWAHVPVESRCEVVGRMAQWLRSHYGEAGQPTELKDEIRTAVGKPLAEADIEVIESATFIDYFCEVAPTVLAPREISLPGDLWPTKASKVYFEPLGVVGVIKPWNYPLEMPIWTIAPALIAGNTVVLKPSERSPTIGLVVGEMAEAAGLPAGVLNVIAGDREVGKRLVESSRVAMVSFTGGMAAGQWIAEECARQRKRATLELGGNDAAIVLDDADPELTANGLIWGAFCNAGQVCVGIKRGLLAEQIAGSLTQRIVEKVKELRLGADIGPIIDSEQLGRIESAVNDAVAKGAKVLVGGKRIKIDGASYFEPTVLVDVKPDMTVVREECFGPVLPIQTFSDVAEGLAMANDSEYGLGASVWTSSKEQGLNVARQLNVGMVWINDVNVAFAEAPWGGAKGSGQGFELSADALLEYVYRKHVSLEQSNDSRRAWWFPYS